MPKLLHNREAAAYVKLPVSTLDRWRQEKKGPKFGKLGRRVFYRQEDLDAWLAAQFADGPSAA